LAAVRIAALVSTNVRPLYRKRQGALVRRMHYGDRRERMRAWNGQCAGRDHAPDLCWRIEIRSFESRHCGGAAEIEDARCVTVAFLFKGSDATLAAGTPVALTPGGIRRDDLRRGAGGWAHVRSRKRRGHRVAASLRSHGEQYCLRPCLQAGRTGRDRRAEINPPAHHARK
jgi:hypothetical protein